MKENEWKKIDVNAKDYHKEFTKHLEDIRYKLDKPLWKKVSKATKVSKLRIVTLTLRMVMAVTILITSSISIFMDMGDVWIAVFCLAFLNIIDLAEREI